MVPFSLSFPVAQGVVGHPKRGLVVCRHRRDCLTLLWQTGQCWHPSESPPRLPDSCNVGSPVTHPPARTPLSLPPVHPPHSRPSSVIARARKQATLEKSLRDCMLQILVEASSKTSHIPPVNFNIDTPVLFPFEVC